MPNNVPQGNANQGNYQQVQMNPTMNPGQPYNPYGVGAPMPPMPNPNQNQNNGKKKRGKGFYIGIAVAAVAIILALIFGIYLFMNSTQSSNRGGSLGQLDGKTEEEIVAELNRVVEEGMFNISIASVVEFDNGQSEGEVKIENSPANHYLMQVEITRNDTGEVIYTSDILEPNYHVQTAKLDTVLPAGTYECTAMFHALDPNTEQEVGVAGAEMAVVVHS